MSLRLIRPIAATGAALLAVAISCPASGQDPTLPAEAWRFRSFTEDANLVGCHVLHLATAARDAIWVATSNGLLHYDGTEWQRFDERHGLPSAFIRTVCLARSGELWVGTDRGAGLFADGSFEARDVAANLPGQSVRRIVEDPDGALWFCCDRWPRGDGPGGLAVLRKGSWRRYGESDGLPSDYVSDFAIVGNGDAESCRRFALTARGPAELVDGRFGQSFADTAGLDAEGYCWSIVEPTPGGLMIAVDDRLLLQRDGQWTQTRPEPRDGWPTKLWKTADGSIITYRSGLAEDRFLRWYGGDFAPISPRLPGTATTVEHLAETADGGNIWVCGGGLLGCWVRSSNEWTLTAPGAGPPDDSIPAFVDGALRTWFANTDTAGFLRDGTWHPIDGMGQPLVLTVDGVVGRGAGGLVRWQDGALESVATDSVGVTDITHWLAGPDGNLWIAGLDRSGRPTLAAQSGNQWRTGPDLPADARVLRFELGPGRRLMCLFARGDEVTALCQSPSGQETLTLPERITTVGPPRVYYGSTGTWLLGCQGLRTLEGDAWRPIAGLAGKFVTAAFENHAGLWFASRGLTGGATGLSNFDGESWHHHEVTAHSLIGVDPDGTRYLSGRLDTLCIVPPAGAPYELRLPIRTQVHRALRDPGDVLWLATPHGLVQWRSTDETPSTAIRHAPVTLTEGDTVVMQVTGRRHLRPARDTGRFQVSYRLDRGAWSVFRTLANETLELGSLPVGAHEIDVRLRDETGAVDPTPANIGLRVLPPPLESRWWFWALSALALASIGAFGGMALRARTVRRALHARLQAELRHRAVVQNAPLGIFEIDLQGRCESANPNGLSMLALSLEAAVGQPISDTFGFDDDWRLEEMLREAAGGSPAQAEFSGRTGIVLFGLVPLQDADGEVRRLLGLTQDVTEQRAFEGRLRHTHKMEALGQFAGGVAHDFNNLLTAVLGNVQLLRTSRAGARTADPAGDDLIDEIETAGQRATDLTRQLLMFARQAPETLTTLDPIAALKDAESLLRRLVPETVAIRCEVVPTEEQDSVRMASGQFEQILFNLAGNSASAMPDGGQLNIRLERITLDAPRPTRFGAIAVGEYWMLSMEDTGTGIPGEVMARIFDPFFSTKPVGEGTGLGLASVHGIVRHADGQIEVDSRLGYGARFRVWLPATAGGPGREAAPPQAVPRGQGETVLVCEDQAMIRRLLQRMLSASGYEVLEAHDGRHAIEIASAFRGPVHLLITDLVMPRLGGRELAAWFAEHRPDTRVLFISGYDSADTEQLDGKLLDKPFNAEQLLTVCRALLDELAAPDTRI